MNELSDITDKQIKAMIKNAQEFSAYIHKGMLANPEKYPGFMKFYNSLKCNNPDCMDPECSSKKDVKDE